ncbi:MAG: ribonuclease H family protein, partial [Candidatus Thiodiazotropha sp.]
IKRPEYWNILGSSKNRTKLQEGESRKLIERAIEESDTETAFIFTDGSCKGNPGPCGAGACIYLPGQEECVELKQPVSRLTSILLGELVALVIALRFIETESKRKRIPFVKIFSDSQSAVGLTTLGWTPSSHLKTVQEVKGLMDSLQQKGTQVEIAWTPGHANIAGNEVADRLAKAAAEEAENMPENDRVITAVDIKTAAKSSCLKKWQRRWDLTSVGRCLYSFRKTVGIKGNRAFIPKFPRVWSKLRTGYCLNEYRHKIGATETPTCNCGAVETCEHYVEDCTEYMDLRDQLKVKLMQQTGLNMWALDLFLTVKQKDEFHEQRIIISEIFEEFLEKSRRFIKSA